MGYYEDLYEENHEDDLFGSINFNEEEDAIDGDDFLNELNEDTEDGIDGDEFLRNLNESEEESVELDSDDIHAGDDEFTMDGDRLLSKLDEEVEEDDDEYTINGDDILGEEDFDDEDDLNESTEDEFGIDEEEIIEESAHEVICEAIKNMSNNEIRELLESTDFDFLTEAKRFTKNTVLSLNKGDELNKRANVIAIMIEKKRNSALYKKYKKYRKGYKSLQKQILAKNGARAQKMAKKQLRVYTKNSNKKLPILAKFLDNKKSNSN